MEKAIKAMAYTIGVIFLIYLFEAVLDFKENHSQQQVQALTPDEFTMKAREKQLDCLAINIYREAGSEPFEGKVAVAQVTLNRVNNGNFGRDVCQVVYQKKTIAGKTICQFSWACNSAHVNRLINKESYAECYRVAVKVLLEGFRLDSIKDALFYHAVYVSPKWSLDRVATIGQHIFYRKKKI